MNNEKIYQMPLSKVYPLLVNKATRKGRTQAEADEIIRWLTGYTQEELEELLESPTTYGDFFRNAPAPHPNRTMIQGSICGIKVEEIQEPLMREIRYLDKLIDELANPENMNRQTPDMPTAARYFPSTSIVCICLLVVPNRLP